MVSLPSYPFTAWLQLPNQLWEGLKTDLSEQIHAADFHVVDDLGAPKVSELRQLVAKVEHSPVGEVRLLLIFGADTVKVQPANILLKLLEEPPAHLGILLISESPHLPATVRSRVMELALGDAAEQSGSDWKEPLTSLNLANPPELQAAKIALRAQPLVHQQIRGEVVRRGILP